MYVLIKTGLIGFFCYMIFVIRVFLVATHCHEADGAVLIKVTLIGLLLSNIVICGLFSNESVFAYIALGYFVGSYEAMK
jgi:hypothetical protein